MLGAMGTIDLVVTDLDGTLWHGREVLHPETAAAWHELERRGVAVMVATGRRLGSTRTGLAQLGVAPPAVVMNGALVQHLGDGTRYHRHSFSRDEAERLLLAFREAGLEPCVYVEHDDYEVYLGPEPSTHPEHAASFGEQGGRSDLDEVVATLPVFMFGILGQTEASLAAFAPSVTGIGETHVSHDFYGGHGITVVPRGLSKWVGVRAYCDAAGLDAGRVLAIGDGLNDVELLDAAAVAVVPADGHDDVVAMADHVVASPRDGGWAELLDLV
jgi:Cof subfamily protein (haloacid dehalogenase superfamily)